eukprot:2681310-Amphidinium_carterae.1
MRAERSHVTPGELGYCPGKMAQEKSYAQALTGEPRARLPGPPKRPPEEAAEREAQRGSGQPPGRPPGPP